MRLDSLSLLLLAIIFLAWTLRSRRHLRMSTQSRRAFNILIFHVRHINFTRMLLYCFSSSSSFLFVCYLPATNCGCRVWHYFVCFSSAWHIFEKQYFIGIVNFCTNTLLPSWFSSSVVVWWWWMSGDGYAKRQLPTQPYHSDIDCDARPHSIN